MARAHFRYQLPDRAGNQVQAAAVWLFAVDTGVVADPATGTAITGSMYALRTGGSPIANPLISNDNGEVEAWLDTPQTMDAVVTRNGGQAHYPGNSAIKLLFDPFKEVVHAYHDPADVGAGGGGGAPTDALYVVTGAHASLTAAKILGTDVIIRGTAAAKPGTPAFDGQLYIETDGSRIVWRGNGTTSWDEIARGEAGIRLAQLAEKAHGSLTGVSADQHHAQSHTHGSHTGIGADDHHAQIHALLGAGHTISGGTAGRFLRETGAASFAFEAIPFSRGGTILDPAGARDIMVWQARFACTVTNVRGHRKGGTGATVNARKNQTSDHLASNLSLGSADAWADGGAVQNTAYAAGDDLEIRLVSIAGAVTEVAIQVDFTRP